MTVPLPNDLVVVSMGADPHPVDPLWDIRAKGSIVMTDTDGPKVTDPLEMERRVARIRFEKNEILVRKRPDFNRQRLVQRPEPGRCQMLQISRAFPSLYAARASATKPASLPALASASIS